MKKQTHPVSEAAHYICGNCGTEITVSSTVQATASLDVCSNCHPAYTGKELEKASGSKVDAFNERFKKK